jgi:hypothetical protein
MARSLALVAALLLLPATASADDCTLREAGRSHDAEFARLGKAVRAAYRAWNDSGHRPRRARRVTCILRRTVRAATVGRRSLARQRFRKAARMHRLALRHERQAVDAIEQVLGPA